MRICICKRRLGRFRDREVEFEEPRVSPYSHNEALHLVGGVTSELVGFDSPPLVNGEPLNTDCVNLRRSRYFG